MEYAEKQETNPSPEVLSYLNDGRLAYSYNLIFSAGFFDVEAELKVFF